MRGFFNRLNRVLPQRASPLFVEVEARVPDGARIYAIGDVHGRLDLLEHSLARIKSHEEARPIGQTMTVMLGDTVDRGLDSRGVVARLIEESRVRPMLFIAGNHEAYMLKTFSEPSSAPQWLAAGGRETLYSYGVSVPAKIDRYNAHTIIADARSKVPQKHLDFLATFTPYAVIGDYAFVHAGIRPGITLVDQTFSDLTTIRDPFLAYRLPHDHIVVHGHTPVSTPDFRTNRINIDTGAYLTGNLTCLVLEGAERYVL